MIQPIMADARIPVRPAISLITTLALVIHFTVGCCLHASHFGGADACCASQSPPGHVETCCHDHEYEHDRDSTATADEYHDTNLAVACCEPASTTSDCGCDGCSCVATTLKSSNDVCGPMCVCWIGHALDATPPQMTPIWGGHVGGQPPDTSALRSPLFERLLV